MWNRISTKGGEEREARRIIEVCKQEMEGRGKCLRWDEGKDREVHVGTSTEQVRGLDKE